MKHIYVLTNGWVLLGKGHKDGEEYILCEGYVVRKWGTDKGLGQLAEEGKKDDTILDPLPLTKFRVDKLMFSIACNEKHW